MLMLKMNAIVYSNRHTLNIPTPAHKRTRFVFIMSLSSLLDKHAPSKRIYVVERPMNNWMTDDILVLKARRRKYESLWR